MSRDAGKKQQIVYPCKWLYKVIGRDRNDLQQAIDKAAGPRSKVTFSNISKKGNYIALNVELKVTSEQQRDRIYQNLKTDPAVIMVI